ncbi:2305_t:CDS:2 [Acaulospora morrowiae]|uniref:2305_t:CDS:1 n=1 Tax=Acaulospora morrowiae TaxID=94023 RepID=A0A9N8Z6P6_9GLOM|nr:2305_t:CDS:2 [Acaulospora morrowiae]
MSLFQSRKCLTVINVVSPLYKHLGISFINLSRRPISSLDTPQDVERAKRWLKKFTKDSIPRDSLDMSFARSSGPGGQNFFSQIVNTKVDLRFNLGQAHWIPEYARKQLAIQKSNKINKKNELIITSDKTRSQVKNIEDCIEKLYESIVEAAQVPEGPSEETLQRIEKL